MNMAVLKKNLETSFIQTKHNSDYNTYLWHQADPNCPTIIIIRSQRHLCRLQQLLYLLFLTLIAVTNVTFLLQQMNSVVCFHFKGWDSTISPIPFSLGSSLLFLL